MEHYEASHSLEQLSARYFLSGKQDISLESLRSKLDVLLDWGIKRYSIFAHRPYLVAALIEQALPQPGVRKATQDNWLDSYMWSWIDHACEVMTGDSAAAAQTLAAELFNREVVSFDAYLARMTALGRTFRHSSSKNNVKKYLDFINSLQLADLSQPTITLQRNITHGFHIEKALGDHEGERQQALACYLDQARSIETTRCLRDCILGDVPAVLLGNKEFTSFNQFCRLLGEFRPGPAALDSFTPIIRIYLLVNVLERRKDYRLLLGLLESHWRKLGLAVSKPVADAIQRHGRLISCFRNESPELYAAISHLAKQPLPSKSALGVLANVERKHSKAEPPLPGRDLSEMVEKLRAASLSNLDQDAIAGLWRSSLEMACLQSDPDARADTSSILAQFWLELACSSVPAWKAHLDSWVADTSPVSPVYPTTFDLCLQLVTYGAMGPVWLLEKLVYPYLDSATQIPQDRNQLQSVATLCMRLLTVDQAHIPNLEDLLLRSAISAKPVMAGYGNPSAIAAFLQRLPRMLLLIDEVASSGSTQGIGGIVTSPCIRGLVMRHENRTKQAFSTAFGELPEKRAFWTSTLGLLLGGSKEGLCANWNIQWPTDVRFTVDTTPGISSTDWRDLATCAPGQGNTTRPTPDERLSLPQAKGIVNAASRLIMSGATSTWWRMCASPPKQEVFMVSLFASIILL